jgi:predicted ATPase/Tfp pilus assembly protein PilF
MEFRILGPLEAVADGVGVPLGGPKQRAVLAELLLHANGAVSREQLTDAVWGQEPPRNAAATLQVYVHGLRRALGAERIETVGGAYRLRVDEGELDLQRFDALVSRARAAIDEQRPETAAEDLEAALALWRGSPLADLAGEGVAAAARELEERRLSAVELRNDALLALGRHDDMLAPLERLIADHPYRERLRAQQIVGLYRAGRQTEALEAYRSARSAWIDELGVEPSPALQELERSVLRHDPALDAPPARRRVTARLPVPPTPLVGRRLEAVAVASLLRSETRLLTLVGPGGTGKTRLALAVAEELAGELEAGAVFVDLSGVSDPALFLPTVAQAIGIADTGRSLTEALTGQLREQALLLVLDNLEQILPAGRDVADLLAGAPALRVLATSRAPLRLSGEHQYPVLPLPLPRPTTTRLDELAQNEAVQLFVARARAVDPAFSLDDESARSIAAICRWLDGLPLALELAAARINLLPPAAMLERLDDRTTALGAGPRDLPERQSTLAATIRWSYDLLGEREQEAFARLGMFVGGFTIEAAEDVCAVEMDVLGSLVDNSLLQRRTVAAGSRLAMLETVRAHALELLGEPDREILERRRVDWLTALAETTDDALPTSDDPAVLIDRLEDEHDNIRAALAWALAAGETVPALRLTSALRPFWEVRGHLGEGARWLEDGLRLAPQSRTAAYWKAVGVSGTLAFHSGNYDRARERFAQMLEIVLALDDADGIARAYSDLGTVAAAVEDLDRASELLGESADRFRAIGEHRRLAIVLGNLGHVAAQRGDYETAIEVTREALEIQEGFGDKQHASVSLLNLGTSSLEAGDTAGALEWLRRCVSVALELRYKEVLAYVLASLVRIRVAEGDHRLAARLSGATDALVDESGVGILARPYDLFRDAKEAARAAIGDEAFEAEYSTGRSVTLEEVLADAGMVERQPRSTVRPER